jgi:SHS2 domain-containing protein
MSKPPFEVLEHTADVGLKVYGRTLPELFVHAALGLVATAVEGKDERDDKPVTPAESVSLSARGADLEELLVNWLSEVLYFMDAEGWVFSEFRGIEWKGNSIQAEGCGYRLLPAERSRAVAVKAVTYHQISVRETTDGWEAVVYFDI